MVHLEYKLISFNIKDKPEDNKLVVESLATVSGCVTCSTSSAAAESCTLNNKAPDKNYSRQHLFLFM